MNKGFSPGGRLPFGKLSFSAASSVVPIKPKLESALAADGRGFDLKETQ
jgi:hypothetical protein